MDRIEGVWERGALLFSLGTAFPSPACRPPLDSSTLTICPVKQIFLLPCPSSPPHAVWCCNCSVPPWAKAPPFCTTSATSQPARETRTVGRGGSGLRRSFTSKPTVKEVLSEQLFGSQQQEQHHLAKFIAGSARWGWARKAPLSPGSWGYIVLLKRFGLHRTKRKSTRSPVEVTGQNWLAEQGQSTCYCKGLRFSCAAIATCLFWRCNTAGHIV